ncbi:MAG: tyrosine-type recombinase/integrase, partial [Fusobacteriaceae bacterium]
FITERKYSDGYHRLTPKMADWTVKKYGAMTGLPKTKFFSHNFRHLIAKTLLDEGTSLDKVKNFLGHTNISTTAIYTMGKASELREVKSSAIKSAKVRIIAHKYEAQYKVIIEAIAENNKISDSKLAELVRVSKATFSRNYHEVVMRIRGEF